MSAKSAGQWVMKKKRPAAWSREMEFSGEPAVFAVVLNWNSPGDTERCVRCLEESTYGNLHILVVDNTSRIPSDFDRRRFRTGIKFISTGGNLGYGGGNNTGIRTAIAEGAQFIWLLNPDVMVESKTLTGLMETMRSDSKIGIVGPKFVFEDSPRIIRNAGYFLKPHNGCKIRRHGLWEEDGPRYAESHMSADFVSGSCLFIRRKTIEEIGLITERYFLYWEDVEFCHRALSAQWKVVVNQEIKVLHGKRSEINQKASHYYHYFFTRNHLHFVKEYYPKFFYKALGLSILRMGRLILRRDVYRGRRRLLAAVTILKGMIDGVFYSDRGSGSAGS